VDNLLQGRRQEDENNIHYRWEKESGRDIIPKNNRWENNLIFHKRFLLQMKGCSTHKILNLTHHYLPEYAIPSAAGLCQWVGQVL
jgi:hypothetical protein